MKKLTLSCIALTTLMGNYALKAQVPVKPAHVIFVLEENYAYSEIIGSALAPTFTALSKTSYTANFTNAKAITHPSEPNYLELFSGSNQGVAGDESGPDANAPFNDCNLGSSLIQNGYSFIGYSEDQPSIGWIAGDVPPYWTKHCPWINWIGYNTNADTIPEKSDLPYTSFPDSNHYSTLPTVSWVIPNAVNDMHDGSPSSAIPNGDNWFKANMMSLVRWASNPANKSIVITIWDENDGSSGNYIPLLVSGGMVIGGNYSTAINHYGVLKTVEDMYGLTECASSSGGTVMPSAMWNVTGINSINGVDNEISTWPVPAKDELNVKITSADETKANIAIYDLTGRLVKEIIAELKSGENTAILSTSDVSSGLYFLKVTGDKINACNKISIVK